MQNVLVLGGTGWLGPELITAFLAADYHVTSLTRGKSGSVPDGATAAVGDRTRPDGYDAVRDERWDVVVDTTWQPGMARSAVDALADATDQWMYVSSNGAYRDLADPGPADDVASLVEPLPDESATSDQYRNAKAACEEAVRSARGHDCLVARSGLLAGPGDVSERFGYWVGRFALAGDGPVLVPENIDSELQLIDVRDTAAWFVLAAQQRLRGSYDVIGPRYTLRELIDVSRRVADYRGEAVLVPDDFLHDNGIKTASEGTSTLPLWAPRETGYPVVSAGPVLASGISYRSLRDTTVDTLVDERARGLDRTRRAGLSRAAELDLIDRYTRS